MEMIACSAIDTQRYLPALLPRASVDSRRRDRSNTTTHSPPRSLFAPPRMPLLLLLLLRPHYTLHLKPKESRRLVEWVGASSPPGEEHAQADGLEDASEGTNSDRVHGALLREHLRDELPSQKVSRKPHIQFNNHVRSQQQENKKNQIANLPKERS
jgi:hypothetical protein